METLAKVNHKGTEEAAGIIGSFGDKPKMTNSTEQGYPIRAVVDVREQGFAGVTEVRECYFSLAVSPEFGRSREPTDSWAIALTMVQSDR